MSVNAVREDIKSLVDGLDFSQKVERSLRLITEAYEEYGDSLVVETASERILVSSGTLPKG